MSYGRFGKNDSDKCDYCLNTVYVLPDVIHLARCVEETKNVPDRIIHGFIYKTNENYTTLAFKNLTNTTSDDVFGYLNTSTLFGKTPQGIMCNFLHSKINPGTKKWSWLWGVWGTSKLRCNFPYFILEAFFIMVIVDGPHFSSWIQLNWIHCFHKQNR